MIKKLIITFYLICFVLLIESFGQKNVLNGELNYPFVIGKPKKFYGIFNGGLKYNITNIKNTYLGFSTYFGILDNKSDELTSIYTNFGFSVEYFDTKMKLSPYISVGYILFSFYKQNLSNYEEINSGLLINPGIKYNISERIFLNLSYDYAMIFNTNSNDVIDKNVHHLKVGLGFRFFD